MIDLDLNTERGKRKREGKSGMDRKSHRVTDGLDGEVGVDFKSECLSKEMASMFFDNPIWLSTKDAAIFLRKFRKIDGKPSEGAIRNAIWRGDLKARKWRRRLYIKKDDLERLLQNSPSVDGGSAWA